MFMKFSARRASTFILPTVAALGGLCATQNGVARAADDNAQKPAIARVGVLFPSDTDGATAHASIGLTYEFRTRSDNPLIFGVYGDYLAPSSKTTLLSGGDVLVSASSKSTGFDAGISGRYRIRSMAAAKPYIGLGVGIYGTSLKPLADQAVDAELDYGAGGKLMAGVEFKSGFMGEVAYEFFPGSRGSTNNINIGGFGLNVGYHF